MEKTCQKCGSPASQIPPKAEWGTQVTSQKTGKKYFVFLKCDNCNWSLSSDPNPRKFTKKQGNSPNNANNSDKFNELMAAVNEIQGLALVIDSKLDSLLKKNEPKD